MTRAAEIAAELIRIPSVNPEGDPGIAEPGEASIAAFLDDWLRDRGAEVEQRTVLPGRPNVIARFPAAKPGRPRLLLAPHTDTVSVAGMAIDPFSGQVVGGKLYGRGAADTKGPMAAMLAAIEALGGTIASLSHEIWFAGLMGEEAGLHGSRALAAQEHFDFVIAAEPTGLQTVHAHKGSARWHIRAHGKAAHASTPEAGSNAIDLAIDAVLWLREAFASATIEDPVLGKPTLSIGRIRGGTKANIVPGACEIEIDIRTVPGFDHAALLDAFRKAWPTLDPFASEAPPLATDPAHPLVRQLEACGAPPATAPWFCDAAAFAQAGIPAVALGPGHIAQAHTADEYIAVTDLDAGAGFFEHFLRSLT